MWMSDCSSLGGPFHWQILSHNSLQGRHFTLGVFYFYSVFVCERKACFPRTARSWCWLARHRDHGVSWRELGLYISDCQGKISSEKIVCKVPFAGSARHPSSLADIASKERGSRTSTVERFLSWGVGDGGCRAVFTRDSVHEPLPSSKRSAGGFGIIHVVSPPLGLGT